jgi:hypothetical protein
VSVLSQSLHTVFQDGGSVLLPIPYIFLQDDRSHNPVHLVSARFLMNFLLSSNFQTVRTSFGIELLL